MIIPDTSIWIEFFRNNSAYYPFVRKLLENQDVLAVGCVFGELLQGAKNKRETNIISRYWDNLPKYIGQNDWIEAGIFSSKNKLFAKGIGLIDCVIIVSARNSNVKIWSLDSKLNSILKEEEKFKL